MCERKCPIIQRSKFILLLLYTMVHTMVIMVLTVLWYKHVRQCIKYTEQFCKDNYGTLWCKRKNSTAYYSSK